MIVTKIIYVTSLHNFFFEIFLFNKKNNLFCVVPSSILISSSYPFEALVNHHKLAFLDSIKIFWTVWPSLTQIFDSKSSYLEKSLELSHKKFFLMRLIVFKKYIINSFNYYYYWLINIQYTLYYIFKTTNNTVIYYFIKNLYNLQHKW